MVPNYTTEFFVKEGNVQMKKIYIYYIRDTPSKNCVIIVIWKCEETGSVSDNLKKYCWTGENVQLVQKAVQISRGK
jgi:hypothetical protein